MFGNVVRGLRCARLEHTEMLKLRQIVQTMVEKTTPSLLADRPSVLALAWVLSNLLVGWIAVKTGHSNLGALAIGALDGVIFSSILMIRASARLEAGMTGLLSGFGLDSITNSGRTIAAFVHGVHNGLEAIVNASTGELPADHHQALELIIMRAIWMALVITLVALFLKWGLGPAAAPISTLVPTEISRGQAA